MSSLFRIDRNSIRKDEIESAGVVVIPGFHELAKVQPAEKKEPPVPAEEPKDRIDEKKEELEKLQKQIAQAKEQAAQIVADAEQKAEEITKHAADAGYEEGLKRAGAELEKEIEMERGELNRLKKDFVAAKEETLTRMESGILDLSLYVAEKVVKETLDRNDEVFLNIVQEALSKVKEQGNIVLKVSKKEYDRFFADDTDEYTVLLKSSGIRIKQDLSVECGECVIETDFGAIKSGTKIQLECIADALHEADEA